MDDKKTARDIFWSRKPILPPNLDLVKRDSIVVTMRGPGGAAIYDFAELKGPDNSVMLLVAYRVPLLARDVDKIHQRLLDVIDERRRRDIALGNSAGHRIFPAIATDVAQPNAREACARANVALFDQAGTAVVNAF